MFPSQVITLKLNHGYVLVTHLFRIVGMAREKNVKMTSTFFSLLYYDFEENIFERYLPHVNSSLIIIIIIS